MGDDHIVPGFSAFVDVQITDGSDFTGTVVGDAQGVSSIDGPASIRLVNAWIAQDFGGQGGIKAGVVDLNTEFDVQSTAALFLNSAFGIGPDFFPVRPEWTIDIPQYRPWPPRLVAAGRTLADQGGPLRRSAGRSPASGPHHLHPVADEGALLLLEARNQVTPDFVIGAGTRRYTARFDAIDPVKGRLAENSGFYAIADGLLYAAP